MARDRNPLIWEASGAAGDLGTLLPLTIGVIAVAGLAPQPVFAGFALTFALTAAVYRLPIPVQPMKAIAAVVLASGAAREEIAAAGVMLGLVLLCLGATGLIERVGRLVPQSVITGLQLGLGISLATMALGLMAGEPVAGFAAVALLTALFISGRVPAALVFLPLAIAAGWAFGLPGSDFPQPAVGFSTPSLPDRGGLGFALTGLALPQIALTLTNAIILTAFVARDRYGSRAERVTPRRLCLTTGLANLILTPFGALPMCHGAGGVVAHWRFGARGWGAPALLAAAFACLALWPSVGLAAIAMLPVAALGAMLFVAAVELGASRRILDCQPSCRPVIAITALACVLAGPFTGLIVGTLAEILRKAIVRRLFNGRTDG